MQQYPVLYTVIVKALLVQCHLHLMRRAKKIKNSHMKYNGQEECSPENYNKKLLNRALICRNEQWGTDPWFFEALVAKMVQPQHRKASLLYDILMCSAAYFVCGVGGDCNNITQSLMRMAAAISHVNILRALQQLLSWHRLTRMFGDPSKASSSSSSPKSWVSSVVSNAFARNMETPHTQTHTHARRAFTFFSNSPVSATPWSR